MTAPQIQILIHALGRAQLRSEVSCEQTTNQLLDELFHLLQMVEPNRKTDQWELWLNAPRGTFRDFKDHYVSYYAGLDDEDGEMDSETIEDWWKEEFPETECWIHFAAKEDVSTGRRTVFLDHRCVIEQCPLACGKQKDASELMAWVLTEVKAAIAAVRNGTYNKRVAKELPPQHRIGTMTRDAFWTATPWLREIFFKNLSERDVAEFMDRAVEEPSQLGYRIKEITANDYFSYCALGYKENRYMASYLPPREQFCFHANGQDEGLTKIDPDSSEAFSEWFHNREQGGSSWKVCKGWRHEYISLFVCEDENGYYLTVSGSSYARCREAIKFYLALHRSGLPVCMIDANQLKNRLIGTEKIGIVPRGVSPIECKHLFPNEDIIDFVHLPEENRWETARRCVWQEPKQVRLSVFEGGDHDGVVA